MSTHFFSCFKKWFYRNQQSTSKSVLLYVFGLDNAIEDVRPKFGIRISCGNFLKHGGIEFIWTIQWKSALCKDNKILLIRRCHASGL